MGEITPPRHGFDDSLLIVADGTTDLANTLCQRIFADRHVGPDGFQQFLLPCDLSAVLKQISQNLETLASQIHLARRPENTEPIQIESERSKANQLAGHRAT